MRRKSPAGRRIGRLLATTIGVLAASLALAAGASASSIVFAGIDGEDGGPGGHGPIANYCSLVNSMLTDVDGSKAAAPQGIAVLGGSNSGSVGAFWNAIDACTPVSVTYHDGAAAIQALDLAPFKMLAVPSTIFETDGSGLDQAEQNALLNRAPDITAHVNAGGALLGFSQTGVSNPYQYVGGVGALSVDTGLGYVDITPTPAGTARGITDALDVCCWHDDFNTVPSGFQVLAFRDTSNDGAAIGTGNSVATEICTNGIDDDNDGLIDDADPDCQTTVPENCTNGVDDDGDGLIDANDPDCSEGPAGDATCSDGIDNDGDGQVDGADSDCQGGGGAPGGKCFGQTPTRSGSGTIVGTSGDDVIVGSPGRDEIYGLGGNDKICARGGNDDVYGGAGDDKVDGDAGDDRLFGGTGNDSLFGDTGNDVFYANQGNDRVFGEAGNDIMSGDEGNDQLVGGDGTDAGYGGSGDDTVLGQNGNDSLFGGADADTLRGGNGNDSVNGGPGAPDSCDGGAGTDSTDGSCESTSTIP